MARGESLDSPLSREHEEVLELWREVAKSQPSGAEFDFANHDRTQTISERADEFVSDPSEERFKAMWDRMHSAIQRGQAGQMLDKWEGSLSELAEVVQDIRAADSYNPEWESQLEGEATVRELFGSLHIDEYPILNSAAEHGLSFFGYEEPTSYEDGAEKFSEFFEAYERLVGHASAEASHGIQVPIRQEIDQLFNVIHKVDGSSIEAETSDAAVELYEAILAASDAREEADASPASDDGLADFEFDAAFWVNQDTRAEVRGEYLTASDDDVWHHDLRQLTPGDVIFHHFESELIGLSVATDRFETYSFRGEDYQRLNVDFQWFAEPLRVDEQLKHELGKEEYRTDKYYPFDKNGNLVEAYVSTLSLEAASFLLQKADIDESDVQTACTSEFDVPSEPTDAEEIERQLEQKKQVVFYGPPGTGKTYRAERFARWWTAQQDVDIAPSDRVETVTFHPSFTYEDFVEGLTVDSDDEGLLEYEIQDGILKRLCNAAQQAYNDGVVDADGEPARFILVIDEINRGNLAQIFGETITILEADKRESMEVSLAHSGEEKFTLPPNLYLIGTMNTADRSIALVDAALRRRFRFIDIPPEVEVLYREYELTSSDDVDEILAEEPTPLEVLQALSIRSWERMNANILDSPDLGKGKQIGHSYLMDLDEPADVKDAWRYDVLPLLEEYHFGQFSRIKQEIFDGTSDPLIDTETERIKSFTLQDLVDTLSDFIGVDIETDFSELDDSVAVNDETNSTSESSGGYPTYPDTYEIAQREILDRAGDLLGSDDLTEVSQDNLDRRSLRFTSANEYVPNSVEFLFKPEPERNGQMIVHVSSENDDGRVSEILSAHRERYEEAGFEVTESLTYRIVQRAWPLEDPQERGGREVVEEFRESETFEEAIEAIVDLIRITDSVFQESEIEAATTESTE